MKDPDYTLQTALQWRQASADEIARGQEKLLQNHVRQAVKAPFYKSLLADSGISPADVGVEKLAALPLTSRTDLEGEPLNFFATPETEHADLSLTSGSTGSPVLVPYTAGDLERLAFNEQMGFYGAGVRNSDRLMLCVTIDRCFIAGLAYYSGLVKLGATAIRSGPGQPARQWELISQLRPTGLVGVPSFLLKLANWAEERGHNPRDYGINTLITIGEPVRKPDLTLTPLGGELTAAWNARVYSSYGATELETAFCDCTAECGQHVHPELMLVEIVDDRGKPVPQGEPGEVVVTPLGVEGFPLVRFRTGDIARLYTAPCACGWNTQRLGPIEGRLAQRLKYKGTTLYPEMIYHILQDIDGIEASYLEVRSAYDLSDEITVMVGTGGNGPSAETIKEMLQAKIRVKPEVIVKDATEVIETMEKAGGRKLQKFFDFRKKESKV